MFVVVFIISIVTIYQPPVTALTLQVDPCAQWAVISTPDLGVCGNVALYATCQGLFHVLSQEANPSVSTSLAALETIQKSVPVTRTKISSSDRYNNYFLYRYLLFSAASYCTDRDTVSETIPEQFRKLNRRPLVVYNLPLLKSYATFDRDDQWTYGFSNTGLLYNLMLDTKSTEAKFGEIILAFRGTATLSNIVTDLDGALIKPGDEIPGSLKKYWTSAPANSQVFRGFFRDLQIDEKFVQNIISDVRILKNRCNSCDLIVTGHSLGGTMALLAGAILQAENLNPFVYTYSATLPGNTAFNDWLFSTIGKGRIVRAVSRNDIVPWFRVRSGFEWPSDVDEANMNSGTGPGLQLCKGGCNSPLSDKGKCAQKAWEDHLNFGGVVVNPGAFCSMLDPLKNENLGQQV